MITTLEYLKSKIVATSLSDEELLNSIDAINKLIENI